MDRPQALSGQKKFESFPSQEQVTTILWETVWNALIRAFLIQILGTVAVDMVGHVIREMIPSAPPVGLKPEAAPAAPYAFHWVGNFISHHQFWVIFCLLYIAIVASRFTRYLKHPRHRKLAAFVLRLNRRLTTHWFRLFALNALGAWVSTIVIMALQQFSLTRMFWNWIWSQLQPLAHFLGNITPGSGSASRWYGWYSNNQAKFLFWLLYSAAICDDLGIPNYKTLLRWGSRRLKRYVRSRWGRGRSVAPPVSTESQKQHADQIP